MRSRISITLLVCMIGAAVAIAALFLPARSFTPSADEAPPPHSPDAPSTETGNAHSETPRATADVSIANFSFTATGPLRPGQEVIVTNNDSAPHTLTANDGSFDTGLLQPGDQASITVPSQPGEFAFFCEVHPSMTGAFNVSA